MGRRLRRKAAQEGHGKKPVRSKYAQKQMRQRQAATEEQLDVAQQRIRAFMPEVLALVEEPSQNGHCLSAATEVDWEVATVAANYKPYFQFTKAHLNGRVAHVPQPVLIMGPTVSPCQKVLVRVNYDVPLGHQPIVVDMKLPQ